MNIAVIGAGGAGLACARLLRDDARVTLFERDPDLGGHARSLPIEVDGVTVHAETGFKYLMLPSHRRTMAWLALHGVPVRRFNSDASLTWEAEGATFVLPPRSLRHVARLLGNPRKLPYLVGLALFKHLTRKIVEEDRWEPTLAEFTHPLLPKDFASGFLQPFFGASWGASSSVIGGFPICDVVRVLPKGVAVAYDVHGGTSAYVAAVTAALTGVEVRTACPVTALRPDGSGVQVTSAAGVERFDRVVLALPGQHAVALLDEWPEWRAVTGQVRTFPTHIVIHSDPAYMPADPRDWCVVNQFHRDGEAFLTEWCGWLERRPVFRTWLPEGRPMPANVHYAGQFDHLVVTPSSIAMQKRIASLQGTGGLYAAGMYVTEVDIHESALASALDVVAAIAPDSAGVRDYRAAIAGGRMPAIQAH
ncbi:MAG: FAD-dependent oxidoreductase [Pseudomonadota bacterium]|nr:FAD-dependent oxidoreductase [Pseudomonadota bacterium]